MKRSTQAITKEDLQPMIVISPVAAKATRQHSAGNIHVKGLQSRVHQQLGRDTKSVSLHPVRRRRRLRRKLLAIFVVDTSDRQIVIPDK
jgi:hypothetical protein